MYFAVDLKVIFELQGLSQKILDKPKIVNASGDICYIFWAYYPIPTMDVIGTSPWNR